MLIHNTFYVLIQKSSAINLQSTNLQMCKILLKQSANFRLLRLAIQSTNQQPTGLVGCFKLEMHSNFLGMQYIAIRFEKSDRSEDGIKNYKNI